MVPTIYGYYGKSSCLWLPRIIAVMAMFYGVGRWNAYFDALIYLQDRAKYPLQIILRNTGSRTVWPRYEPNHCR